MQKRIRPTMKTFLLLLLLLLLHCVPLCASSSSASASLTTATAFFGSSPCRSVVGYGSGDAAAFLVGPRPSMRRRRRSTGSDGVLGGGGGNGDADEPGFGVGAEDARAPPRPPPQSSGGRTTTTAATLSRRESLRVALIATATAASGAGVASAAAAVGASSPLLDGGGESRRGYVQRFPALFSPLFGASSRRTVRRRLSERVWALEQNLELGPLQVPVRCVVIALNDGTLWVQNPLAPTEEFFDLVESCAVREDGGGGVEARSRKNGGVVSHVVVSTYALEHKVFARDALERWPDAELWTSPGQFSFPIRTVSEDYVWGRAVSGVLEGGSDSPGTRTTTPLWIDEIEYETLESGTFHVGSAPVTFYETAFFHKRSRTLLVADALAKISSTPPELNDPDLLLLVSKRSTSDPQPADTPEGRRIGWEKTALLVSYFFPEHEEFDADYLRKPGVVTWTEGWHDNFLALSDRLLVPPVVRTLVYAQNPKSVRRWVDRVAERWDFRCIVPAHFDAPIEAGPREFRRAFEFLEDGSLDAFPEADMRRGLKPIADLVLGASKR